MEFVLTYGWPLLIVLAAIGALAYFGVLSPDTLLRNVDYNKCFDSCKNNLTLDFTYTSTCERYKRLYTCEKVLHDELMRTCYRQCKHLEGFPTKKIKEVNCNNTNENS